MKYPPLTSLLHVGLLVGVLGIALAGVTKFGWTRSAESTGSNETLIDEACSASTGETTNLSEVSNFHLYLWNERVEVHDILLGVAANGDLGFAYLVGTRSNGELVLIDKVAAFELVSADLSDLQDGYLGSTIPGERRQVGEMRVAKDADGRLYISYWKGEYEVSGIEFVHGSNETAFAPICCKLQLGISNCSSSSCTGTCTGAPFSCACHDGVGLCYSQSSTLCYGNCGVSGCNPGQCAHWIDPQGVERCGCRTT